MKTEDSNSPRDVTATDVAAREAEAAQRAPAFVNEALIERLLASIDGKLNPEFPTK